MSFTGVVMLAGGATAINVMGVYQEGRDPFPSALAGGIFVTSLAFIDEGAPQIADALAGLFLVTTLLVRGVWFFNWLSALTSGKATGGTVKKINPPTQGTIDT